MVPGQNETSSRRRLGYIVIQEKGGSGYIGGYLCADDRGIPIEFLHTNDSPINTDRYQELLYGKTLMPELFGRHIAGTLIGNSSEGNREKPSILFTKEEAVLQGFDDSNIIVAMVDQNISNSASDHSKFSEKTISTSDGELLLKYRKEEAEQIEKIIPELENVHILEPFERVINLLNELSGKGSETRE